MIRLVLKLAILVALVVLALWLYHRFEPGIVHAVHSHGLAPAISRLGRNLASRVARTARGR